MNRRLVVGIGAGLVLGIATAWFTLATFFREPAPGEWRHYTRSIGDFRRFREASVDEIGGGPGRLLLFCGGGPIFDTGRGTPSGEGIPARFRYVVDGDAPAVVPANFDGNSFWFDPPADGSADPIVARIERGRLLVMRSATYGMAFDVSRAGDALRRLRAACANDA